MGTILSNIVKPVAILFPYYIFYMQMIFELGEIPFKMAVDDDHHYRSSSIIT